MTDPTAGGHFAAELNDLMKVGSVDLPAMAYTYATLNHRVDSTSSGDHACFDYDEGGISPVAGPWSKLRDELVDILGQSSSNLQQAAAAVVNIVWTYAETDQSAEQTLTDTWITGVTPPTLAPGEIAAPGAPGPVVIKR